MRYSSTVNTSKVRWPFVKTIFFALKLAEFPQSNPPRQFKTKKRPVDPTPGGKAQEVECYGVPLML
jgi:hypothetical protein